MQWPAEDWHDEGKTGNDRVGLLAPGGGDVEPSGLASAVAAGTTQVRGEYRGHSDETTLTVVSARPAVQQLVAGPAALSFKLTSSGRSFAYVIDRDTEQVVSFVAEDGVWQRKGTRRAPEAARLASM